MDTEFETFYFLLQSKIKDLQVKRHNISRQKWRFTKYDKGYLKAISEALKVLKKEYYDFVQQPYSRKNK